MYERSNNLIFTPSWEDITIREAWWKFWETIDLVKLASKAVFDFWYDQIRKSNSKFNDFWIWCYLWWWVTESMIRKTWLTGTVNKLNSLWVRAIEVWRDSLWLSSEKEFQQLVMQLSQNFEKVIVEIWTKSGENGFSHDYKAWSDSLDSALESSANSIVLEWWMWFVWIYDNFSRTKTLLLLYLVRRFQRGWSDKELIIETWGRKIQEYIISLLWPNVKLWNIPTLPLWANEESLSLEWIDDLRTRTAQNYDENLLEWLFEVIDIIFQLCKEHNINPNYFFFSGRYYDLDFDTERTIEGIKWEITQLTKPKWWFIIPWNATQLLAQMWVTL